MSDTQVRRAALLKLVQDNRIRSQTRLIQMLKKQGIRATQATISRDIHNLGLVKAFGYYSLPGKVAQVSNPAELLKGKILSFRRAGNNLVVIHTHPGEAGFVGHVLDSAGWSSIAGTVAGDDTIFVACDSAASSTEIRQRLGDFAPEVV